MLILGIKRMYVIDRDKAVGCLVIKWLKIVSRTFVFSPCFSLLFFNITHILPFLLLISNANVNTAFNLLFIENFLPVFQ